MSNRWPFFLIGSIFRAYSFCFLRRNVESQSIVNRAPNKMTQHVGTRLQSRASSDELYGALSRSHMQPPLTSFLRTRNSTHGDPLILKTCSCVSSRDMYPRVSPANRPDKSTRIGIKHAKTMNLASCGSFFFGSHVVVIVEFESSTAKLVPEYAREASFGPWWTIREARLYNKPGVRERRLTGAGTMRW